MSRAGFFHQIEQCLFAYIFKQSNAINIIEVLLSRILNLNIWLEHSENENPVRKKLE